MRKVLGKAISVALSASLAFTSVNLTGLAAEPVQDVDEIVVETAEEDEEAAFAKELRDAVSEEEHPGGVFGFYETVLNAEEGDEQTVSVVRQGSTDQAASVVFKAVDVSAEYKKDYTLSIEKGIFGEKELPAAEDVRPLIEEYGEIADEEDLEASIETDGIDLTEENEEEFDEVNVEDTDEEASYDSTEEISVLDEDADLVETEDAESTEEKAGTTFFGGGSSLSNIYSLQTGEEAPEHDWTEYTVEEVSEDTKKAMGAGWDETRENLASLPGVTATLSFAPGEYRKDIKVKVKDDDKSESDEVVLFVLQDAENAEIGDSYNGYLNIKDNDSHEQLTYSVKEKSLVVSPEEYVATVTIQRNSGIDQMDFVSVGTLGLDAEPDVDYRRTNQELLFAAGDTEKQIEIPILSDRSKETHFWVGVTSSNGTVTEDNACLVTIEADPIKLVNSSGYYQEAPEIADNNMDDADFQEVPSLGDAKRVEYVAYDYEKDPYHRGYSLGGDENSLKYIPECLDIKGADYIRVEYKVWGYTERWFINDKTKVSSIILLDTRGKDIAPRHYKEFSASLWDCGKVEYENYTFYRGANETWDVNGAWIYFRVRGESGTRNCDVNITINKVVVGYTQHKIALRPDYKHMDQYVEQIYKTAEQSEEGQIITYPETYFTDANGNQTQEITVKSCDKVTTARAAKGKRANSMGIYATDDSVNFLGYKLIKSSTTGELSKDIVDPSFTVNNEFKIKFRDYIHDDGTILLVPVYEPKKVVVAFNNDNATVADNNDVKGCFDGFKSGAELKATMLDTLCIKGKANAGYAISGMALQQATGFSTLVKPAREQDKYCYKEVSNNSENADRNEFKTALCYPVKKTYQFDVITESLISTFKVVLNYDTSYLIVAPSPLSQNGARNGSILYVDKVVKENGTDDGKVIYGGDTLRIDGVSINKAYVFGSVPAEGYHTFWKDGTLDSNGDGIINDTNPFYKSFQNSYGQSFRYVTQLPASKIYYNFVRGVDMKEDEKPVPIRGWLVLKDRLLISGAEIQKGLNDIDVFCDGVETKTKNGGYDGREGDGYYELVSDNYYDLFTYAVTFTGSSSYGDVATMAVQNPGTNKDIVVETWKDLNITDVNLFMSVEKKDKSGYEYQSLDTSGARTGYYTGLTDGDYDYRIQMTAHRDGVNITAGEIDFVNQDGSNVTIKGQQDENGAGIFSFDFNPQKKGIHAGAKAYVTFSSGDVRFLSRDVGVEVRASIGAVNIVNLFTLGNVNSYVDIVGVVSSAIDMGWSGEIDKVTTSGEVTVDDKGNKIIKVGLKKTVIDYSTKDKLLEQAKKTATSAQKVGKLNSKIAQLEGALEKAADDKKEKIEKELEKTREEMDKAEDKHREINREFKDMLSDAKEPKKNTPKFGQKFNMDLGFSFQLAFGYDEDVNQWYFKNMMLTGTVESSYEVTMNYAIPIGITIGIGLKLELTGDATFVVEQRNGFEDSKDYRYYVTSANKDKISVFDTDPGDPDRKLDRQGLFSIKPTITLTLSAGIAGDAIKVSVSGKAAFNMVFGTKEDSAGACVLSASIAIKALIFTFKKELVNKPFRLWGNPDLDKLGQQYSGQILSMISEPGDSYLYDSIDAFEAEDVSYLSDGIRWYGGSAEDATFDAIDEGGMSTYRENPVADKIAADSAFDMVPLGGGKFAAVFLNVPTKRAKDKNNSKAAYYTYYDGETWSVPVLLEDDYSLDQYPRIYSLGEKGAFAVWSSVANTYKDTEDLIVRSNALDIHGRFISPDGKLSNKVEIVTKTTEDANAETTGINLSDFSSDRAIGVFMNDEKLVVCYEKCEYTKGADEESQVGDMLYPVSTIIASRAYDFEANSWVEGTESLESLPGLLALGTDVAKERIKTYNKNVYGQKFYDYLPGVVLVEDINSTTGYYREGGAGTSAKKLDDKSKAIFLDSDAINYYSNGKDYGVFAYTIDLDGDMHTLTDRELYLATYDMESDSFSEPISLTGYEVNADTSEAKTPQNSNPKFVKTDFGLYLLWLKDENILALNTTNLLEHSEELIKTGTEDGISYRYVDKNPPVEGKKIGYVAPDYLVSGRISDDAEDSSITSDIHSFDAETDGRYIYVVWPESSDDKPDYLQNGLTDVQMWCIRSASVNKDGDCKLVGTTEPVQITSAYENNYDDIAFGVSDGKMIGLARKVPSKYISEAEARLIHGESFNEETFVPYAIWDDKNATPVSFWVDPSSIAKIRSGEFLYATAGEGAAFSFEILNDGFDSLIGATVSATDRKGNELLAEESRNVPELIGGESAGFAGYLPLDVTEKEAEVSIVIKTKDGEQDSYVINQELKPDLNVQSLSVVNAGDRGLYRVTGVVHNDGNGCSEAKVLKLYSKKEESIRNYEKVNIPVLAPSETYEIDTLIDVADEDFRCEFEPVNLDTGEVVESTGDIENVGYKVTETLALYASYAEEDDEVELPVFEYGGLEFVTRIAYPSELKYIDAVTGVAVEAIKPVEDADGNISGQVVSAGKGLLILEEGEKVSLISSIESTLGGKEAAVDEDGNEVYKATGAEGLSYKYDFIGEEAEFNENGLLEAVKQGTGKLVVYVYPSDRKFEADNYLPSSEDVQNSAYNFAYMSEGDNMDTFCDYPEHVIRKFIIDVDVVESGRRESDIDSTYFEDSKGILYRKYGKGVVAVCGINKDKKITNLTIPATVSNAGTTYKVFRIDANAFSGNKALKSVTIGKNVRDIRSNAFSDCEKLTKVTFGSNVESIGDDAFNGCISLKNFTLPAKLLDINNRAFMDCHNITSLVIPVDVGYIGDEAFRGCVSLKSVTIKSERLASNKIGKDAFLEVDDNCVFKFAMKNEEVKKALTSAITEESETFHDSKGICYKINSTDNKTVSVTGLTEAANGKLKTVAIPAAVEYKGNKYKVISVENGAFAANKKLTTATFPASVTIIKDEAFAEATALKSIVFPATVEYVGTHAFRGCTSLTKVTIKGDDIRFGADPFKDVPDTAVFNISVKNLHIRGAIIDSLVGSAESFTDANGNIYKMDRQLFRTVNFAGISNPATKSVSVPGTVKYRGDEFEVQSVEPGALRGNTTVTSVTLGKGIFDVGESAFENCTSLKTFNGKGVVSFRENSFAGCSKLSGLNFSADTEYIGIKAFEGCKALKSITITKGVRTIDERAFADCSALKTVTIKSNLLLEIGIDAFSGNHKNCTYKIVPKAKRVSYKELLVDSGVDPKKIK